jgi:uncharacterized Ntn-hydrolase superfamily protein
MANRSIKIRLSLLFLAFAIEINAQDTFSIVAVDSATGEVGSAGASCVDLFSFNITDPSFLGDLIPGVGAINTQASYHPTNQANARQRMQAGDTPAQIISWLKSNDVTGDSTIRQYGIAALINNQPQTAAHTGTNCLSYKSHIAGVTYSIQGNILLGQSILDSMESRFLNTNGPLVCKLMAALQGANVVGADTRCSPNGTSSLFAFVKVTKPDDQYGSPYISLGVRTHNNDGIEPIDSLQQMVNSLCPSMGTGDIDQNRLHFNVYPNPGSGNSLLQLNCLSSKDETVVVTFNDVLGKVCLQQTLLLRKGANHKSIVIDHLLPGLYFIQLGSEQFQGRAVKFVKN